MVKVLPRTLYFAESVRLPIFVFGKFLSVFTRKGHCILRTLNDVAREREGNVLYKTGVGRGGMMMMGERMPDRLTIIECWIFFK